MEIFLILALLKFERIWEKTLQKVNGQLCSFTAQLIQFTVMKRR